MYLVVEVVRVVHVFGQVFVGCRCSNSFTRFHQLCCNEFKPVQKFVFFEIQGFELYLLEHVFGVLFLVFKCLNMFFNF